MAVLIIHGGAGAQEGDLASRAETARHLADIADKAYAYFASANAREVVLCAIRLLEDDPLFNAGTGSKLQSDSATVAGTYASPAAGVSCTGIGEQIVNHAAAARIVTRIEDGASLDQALAKTIAEANQRAYAYGLICLNRHGEWAARQTGTVTTLFACADGTRVVTFMD